MRIRIALVLTSFLTLGCASKPELWSWTPSNPMQQVEVPLDLPARGMPIVTIARTTANDDAKIVATIALIDTGAAHSRVSAKYADLHHLDVRKVNGVRIARVKSIKIGDAKIDDFDAIVEDLKSNPAMSDKLDFVLGRSLFAGVLLTIDYPHQRLTIEHGALRAPSGHDILPMKRSATGEFLIPITVKNQESWMVLDTAHTGVGITLAPSRASAMKWASPPIDSSHVSAFVELPPSQIGRMEGEVHIAGYTLLSPIVAVSRGDDRERIGAELLRNFIVTIDQKNNRVRLTRITAKPIEAPPLRRLGFDFTDSAGKIEVIKGSGAQQAGLLDDDRIISIDGIPLDRFKYQQRDTVERKQTNMMVRFERDGQEKVARVPLTVIVP